MLHVNKLCYFSNTCVLKYLLRHSLVIRSLWPRAKWRHFPALNSNITGLITADWNGSFRWNPHFQIEKDVNFHIIAKNFLLHRLTACKNLFCFACKICHAMPKSKLSRPWRVIWWIELLFGMPTPRIFTYRRHIGLSRVIMQISHELQQLQ